MTAPSYAELAPQWAADGRRAGDLSYSELRGRWLAVYESAQWREATDEALELLPAIWAERSCWRGAGEAAAIVYFARVDAAVLARARAWLLEWPRRCERAPDVAGPLAIEAARSREGFAVGFHPGLLPAALDQRDRLFARRAL